MENFTTVINGLKKMIENILEISQQNLYLHSNRGFLIIEEDKKEIEKIPIDEISTLLITNSNNSISLKLIEKLLENNIVVVFCGKNYLPISILQPLDFHTNQKMRLDLQVSVKSHLKAELWQSLMKHKIYNQAQVLKYFKLDYQYLINLSQNVLLNDSKNYEAVSAQKYFTTLFGGKFYRDDESNIMNALLNYGYAVIRGTVARSICACGFNMSLGIHHKNQFNSFCLVDDIMEPFRPFVDILAIKIFEKNRKLLELDNETKKILASILTLNIRYDGKIGSLANAIMFFSQTLLKSYLENKNMLIFPEFYLKNLNDIIKI